jgi:hypothetical protein
MCRSLICMRASLTEFSVRETKPPMFDLIVIRIFHQEIDCPCAPAPFITARLFSASRFV